MIEHNERELEQELPHESAQSDQYLLTEDDCAEFQSMMPERIAAGEDLQTHPHMLTCERCRALVRDLEYIAEAARQLFPVEAEPPDELWAEIERAIERGEA